MPFCYVRYVNCMLNVFKTIILSINFFNAKSGTNFTSCVYNNISMYNFVTVRDFTLKKNLNRSYLDMIFKYLL